MPVLPFGDVSADITAHAADKRCSAVVRQSSSD